MTIENQAEYVRTVRALHGQCNGGAGGFVLSRDKEILALRDSALMPVNPFYVELSDRKTLQALYKTLNENFVCSALQPSLTQCIETVAVILCRRLRYGGNSPAV